MSSRQNAPPLNKTDTFKALSTITERACNIYSL